LADMCRGSVGGSQLDLHMSMVSYGWMRTWLRSLLPARTDCPRCGSRLHLLMGPTRSWRALAGAVLPLPVVRCGVPRRREGTRPRCVAGTTPSPERAICGTRGRRWRQMIWARMLDMHSHEPRIFRAGADSVEVDSVPERSLSETVARWDSTPHSGPEPVIDAACQALVAGLDSPALRTLARSVEREPTR
jgi:hypothetical protein